MADVVRRHAMVDDALAAPPGWRAQLDGRYPERESGELVPHRVHRLPLGLGLMFGAGLLSALLGIGSSVLEIPAMDTALRLPLKVSSAISGFMIGVTTSASAGAYLLRGQIVPAIAAPVALGSVLGAIAGTWLLLIVPANRLRLALAAVLVALALQMAWADGGPRGLTLPFRSDPMPVAHAMDVRVEASPGWVMAARCRLSQIC